MTIIVEDGTGVVGANSFIDVGILTGIATARGITLPTIPAELEILIVKSMDYLSLQEEFMQGHRTLATQNLMFPRHLVRIHGVLVEDDEIPEELVMLQALLAIASNTMELMPNIPGGTLTTIKFRAGPVERTSETSSMFPVLTHANRLLALLSGSGSRITSRRG